MTAGTMPQMKSRMLRAKCFPHPRSIQTTIKGKTRESKIKRNVVKNDMQPILQLK